MRVFGGRNVCFGVDADVMSFMFLVNFASKLFPIEPSTTALHRAFNGSLQHTFYMPETNISIRFNGSFILFTRLLSLRFVR